MFDWIREANRREGPVGDAQLREMLEIFALDNLLEARRRGRREELVELAQQRTEARARKDFAEADRLRDEVGRPAGRSEMARRPGPRARCPSAVIVYGRNAVREALRGKRRVRRIWAVKGDWSGAPVTQASPARHHRPLRLGRPPGRVRGRRGLPLRRRRRAAGQPEPFLVALDEVTDPQNLGAVCRTAEVAGATGVILPERRSAEVTPAVCKASAGAVEHLDIAQVRNLADFLRDAKEAECWVYGAAAGARTRTGRRTTAAGSSWCSERRGKASGRG